MEYDKTLKIGNTTIHIVAPKPKTPEEVKQVLDDYYKAGWLIIEELNKKQTKL